MQDVQTRTRDLWPGPSTRGSVDPHSSWTGRRRSSRSTSTIKWGARSPSPADTRQNKFTKLWNCSTPSATRTAAWSTSCARGTWRCLTTCECCTAGTATLYGQARPPPDTSRAATSTGTRSGTTSTCSLQSVSFKTCSLQSVSFKTCSLQSVSFETCLLQSVSFETCSLQSVSFKTCSLQSVSFKTCSLQ